MDWTRAIVPLYAFCGCMEWGYWLTAVSEEGQQVMATVILFGWAAGIVWPVHIAALFWQWVL